MTMEQPGASPALSDQLGVAPPCDTPYTVPYTDETKTLGEQATKTRPSS